MKYADGLRNMLASYHKVVSSLDDAEVRYLCLLQTIQNQFNS